MKKLITLLLLIPIAFTSFSQSNDLSTKLENIISSTLDTLDNTPIQIEEKSDMEVCLEKYGVILFPITREVTEYFKFLSYKNHTVYDILTGDLFQVIYSRDGKLSICNEDDYILIEGSLLQQIRIAEYNTLKLVVQTSSGLVNFYIQLREDSNYYIY